VLRQALIPEAAVEALDVGVLHGFAEQAWLAGKSLLSWLLAFFDIPGVGRSIAEDVDEGPFLRRVGEMRRVRRLSEA
jgi:hypothetical protein